MARVTSAKPLDGVDEKTMGFVFKIDWMEFGTGRRTVWYGMYRWMDYSEKLSRGRLCVGQPQRRSIGGRPLHLW